ncbi:Rab family GTPase [Promethearchaeum syntrophicum]|uniref:Rab family GTPase n=1 Tax=Promethearchaeum syntrophicum TaxID=2594042 RepID=A0A5B9D9F1_9ARCH|nr:Rab family GTPase [Candidatus Prometheoarchaeum syntrophicum]QEE15713.1 Ras family protein [Candidatus Prometheoarchaeum syntrophicum]
MDYKCKMSIIGDENVGKTSIILRYLNNTFTNQYITTLGADFVDKVYFKSDLPSLNPEDSLTVTIWDLGGQKSFQEISTLYCEGSAGIMIVFDVSNVETFNSVPNWIDFAKNCCPKAQLVLIGNKSDLESTIDADKIRNLEKEIGSKVYFSSAKVSLTNKLSNINNIFENMAENLLKISR